MAIALQMVPLPGSLLARVSPAAPALLRELDPGFATGLRTAHALSLSPRDTAVALALYGAFVVLAVGLYRLFSLCGARAFVEGLTIFGAILALIGIVQKPLANGLVYGFWEPQSGPGLPFGPFVNRNHFAGWMLMALPLTLALLLAGIQRGMPPDRRGWRDRIVWLSSPEANRLVLLAGASVVMALSLVMTMSRSGITALALSLLLTGGFALRATTRSRRAIGVAYLILLAVVVAGWVGSDAIVARFSQTDWSEFNHRRGAWADAWSVVRAFPLAGTGVNAYRAAALFYQREATDAFFAQAHNDYLQLAAEGGLLVMVPAVAAVVLFVVGTLARMREGRGSTSWWLRAGALTGLTAMALQELVEFSLQMPANAALFAALCAIALHRASPALPPGARHQASARLR